MHSIRLSQPRQLADTDNTAEPGTLFTLQCRHPVSVLVADKPVFGAKITLNERWARHSTACVEAGQSLAWLTPDICDHLFVPGTISQAALFSTAQLILSPTRAMRVFRCHREDYTTQLFCFSLSNSARCSFCSSTGHQRCQP